MDWEHVTPEGYRELREAMDALERRRQELTRRRAAALTHGDLRENAEYEAVEQELSINQTRVRELEERLQNACVEARQEPEERNTIGIGSHVRLHDVPRRVDVAYEITGTVTAEPAEGTLSIDSPLGRALAGHRAGDTVSVAAPEGEQEYRVVTVE